MTLGLSAGGFGLPSQGRSHAPQDAWQTHWFKQFSFPEISIQRKGKNEREVKLHKVVKYWNECSIFIIIIQPNTGKPHEQMVALVTKLSTENKPIIKTGSSRTNSSHSFLYPHFLCQGHVQSIKHHHLRFSATRPGWHHHSPALIAPLAASRLTSADLPLPRKYMYTCWKQNKRKKCEEKKKK